MNFAHNIDQDFSMDPNEDRANLFKRFDDFGDSFFNSRCNQFSKMSNHFEGDSSVSENNVRNIPIKLVDREEGEKKTNQEFEVGPGGASNLSNNQNVNFYDSASSKENNSCLQPRVHHIPITIESNEVSNQSQNNPFSESSSKHSPNSESPIMVAKERSWSGRDECEIDHNQNNTNSFKTSKVYNIPIQFEKNTKVDENVDLLPVSENSIQPHTLIPLPGQSSSTSKKVNPVNVSPAVTSAVGSAQPNVTRIPGLTDQSEESNNSEESNQLLKPNVSNIIANKDPLYLIKEINTEINNLKVGVDLFNGDERLYRWLDEMLTRCMLKLDNVEWEGRDDVRQARKASLALIDKTLAALEEKVRYNSIQAENEVKNETKMIRDQNESEKKDLEEKMEHDVKESNENATTMFVQEKSETEANNTELSQDK